MARWGKRVGSFPAGIPGNQACETEARLCGAAKVGRSPDIGRKRRRFGLGEQTGRRALAVAMRRQVNGSDEAGL